MRSFIAFTKKEILESWRTYRLPALVIVFIVFGMMSPLFAKLLPDILNNLGGDVVITMPKPTAMDSWRQFFKNVGQMGMLVIIISFSGIMANELSKGTLINLLTKGMKRSTIILSKFISASLLWLLSYVLCLLVCFAYTEYFWSNNILEHAFLVFSSLWLFGEFLIALLLFGGIAFGKLYGSLIMCLGAIGVFTILGIFPTLQKYNPISLSGDIVNLLNAQKAVADFMPATIVCIVLTVVLIMASILVFNKKYV
jgi:ABC-2 type transport system permease protein